MPFDEQRYVSDVLDPARQAGDTPPEDLLVRYQISERSDEAEITETVKQVRQCWRRHRGQHKYRRLVDRLESDHAKLAPAFRAAEKGDLGPLREALAASAKRAVEREQALRRRLMDAAGRLRLISPELLAGIATSAGVSLGRAQETAGELELEVVEPQRLPEGYPGYETVRKALAVLDQPHLAGFVFGSDCVELRVLDRVQVRSGASIAGRLDKIRHDSQIMTRSSLTTTTDAVLASLRDDPEALIRYDIVARLRERVREHSYDDSLMRHATGELCLEGGEARRLVFAVRHERGVSGSSAGRLRELLDAGEIQGALEFGAALPQEALTGEAAALLSEVRTRLEHAERLRDEALRDDDPDEAWVKLEQALIRVPDLSGARELMARLVPAPARAVNATVDGADVVVSWRPSPSKAGRVGYEVLRNDVPLVTTSDTFVRDIAAPVNVELVYTVAARRGDASASAARGAGVTVRPEPAEVRLAAADGVVTGRWIAPPEAMRVEVSRDGTPVRVDGNGFRDTGVRNGHRHTFLVRAVYAGPGGEARTPGVLREVTPHARPEPLTDFTVESAGPGQALVRCAEPAVGRLEFLVVEGRMPWSQGDTLPFADVRREGRLLDSAPARGGYLVQLGPGRRMLVALTVAGDVATVGPAREHVHLAPVQQLTAQRRGAVIQAGFDWPAEVPEAEVRWAGQSMIVSAAAYRAQGGLRLPAPEDQTVTVEVAPMLRGTCGPSATVTLPAVATVRYELRFEGLLGRRRLVVRLWAERQVRLARLVLVHKAGRLQPQSERDGVVVAEWTDLELPVSLQLASPGVRKPYWLRCFADEDVELVDPPVRQLKVE